MRRSCPRASRPRHLCRMFRNRDPLRRRPMAAVSVERLVQELEKLKQQMDAGALKAGDYDQRLARVIRELRERKLDADRPAIAAGLARSEEHTSELQSLAYLVCRLLLEKKKKTKTNIALT